MTGEPDFLKYFVKHTDKSFNELKTEIVKINHKLEDIGIFKAEIKNDAKWRALLISALAGGLTFLISTGVSAWMVLKGHAPEPPHAHHLFEKDNK